MNAFQLFINLENAAFEDSNCQEIVRILYFDRSMEIAEQKNREHFIKTKEGE